MSRVIVFGVMFVLVSGAVCSGADYDNVFGELYTGTHDGFSGRVGFAFSAETDFVINALGSTQIGYIIKGKVKFIAEDVSDEFQVFAGDSYVFNPNQKHGTEVLEDTEYVEVFSPSRQEYEDF